MTKDEINNLYKDNIVFDDILKENDVDNKPSAIGMTSLINHTLNNRGEIEVTKNNMLTVGALDEVDKDEAIKECINFISEISFHIATLEKYVNKNEIYNFDKDISSCKEHINKVINVIFEISKE